MTEAIATVAHSRVTCQPSGQSFEVPAGVTILDAALRQGLALPHSCKNGICGTCKAKILEGAVAGADGPSGLLTPEELREGYALLCQATPLSAVTVECKLVAAAAGIPLRRLVSRVHSLERLAPDVMRIRLKLPANERMQFLAGQYINIVFNGGIRRSLSLANAPHDTEFLELHLRNYGGPFSTHVFTKMKVGDILRVEGPMGTFFVRDESEKPMVFVASGTGFAPVKAMIEHEVLHGVRRPMTLYWGGRRPADLYLNDLAEKWAVDLGLAYVPVVSEPQAEDAWSGRTGFVHRAVMDDIPDMSGHQVYACGAPVVVESARNEFTRTGGLPEAEFFADAFVPGSTPVASVQR